MVSQPQRLFRPASRSHLFSHFPSHRYVVRVNAGSVRPAARAGQARRRIVDPPQRQQVPRVHDHPVLAGPPFGHEDLPIKQRPVQNGRTVTEASVMRDSPGYHFRPSARQGTRDRTTADCDLAQLSVVPANGPGALILVPWSSPDEEPQGATFVGGGQQAPERLSRKPRPGPVVRLNAVELEEVVT